MKVSSDFALLDVTKGRIQLLKDVTNGPIPVTITGFITGRWGHDDGVSIEFSVDVTEVKI